MALAEADRLIWDATRVHSLVTYLDHEKKPCKRREKPPRVAVVIKSCDSYVVNVLPAEQHIDKFYEFIEQRR